MTRLSFATACLLLSGLACLQASPLYAKEKRESAPPSAYQRLLQCRGTADPETRLACYDNNVSALQQAKERKELVIVDREEVREAKKGLFGLSLPNLKLFGDDKDEDVAELESTIASARQYTPGRWRLVLEDGAIWDQIDDAVLSGTPTEGNKITIKRAAFGSFKARIKNQPGIRVRRIQ